MFIFQTGSLHIWKSSGCECWLKWSIKAQNNVPFCKCEAICYESAFWSSNIGSSLPFFLCGRAINILGERIKIRKWESNERVNSTTHLQSYFLIKLIAFIITLKLKIKCCKRSWSPALHEMLRGLLRKRSVTAQN